MLRIFELDINTRTVYWLYEKRSNRTSNKKGIHKVHELFAHPSYVHIHAYGKQKEKQIFNHPNAFQPKQQGIRETYWKIK